MDSDESMRRKALDILKVLGFDVTLAGDEWETIEKYSSEIKISGRPFDAVIMTPLHCRDKKGLRCIEALKRIDPHVRILLTSRGDDPIADHFEEYGFNGVVRKPYEIEAFSKALLGVKH